MWIKRKERQVKEKIINGINNDDMMTEIIRKLTAVEKVCDVTSEQVLAWAN